MMRVFLSKKVDLLKIRWTESNLRESESAICDFGKYQDDLWII